MKRKVSFEKSSGTFSLKLGGTAGSEVVQESEAFTSNRLAAEMERWNGTTTTTY